MIRLCAVVLLVVGSQYVMSDTHVLNLRTNIITASPAMEIGKLESSWENPGQGRYAQGRANVEVGYRPTQSVEIGIEKRWHYVMAFSNDTAVFYSALENNQVPIGEYQLDFSVNAAEAKGVFASYFIPLSNRFAISVTSHLLQGIRVQQGRLNGQGEVDGGDLFYDWQLDYAYDENRLFEGPRQSPEGWGHSFDIRLNTKINANQKVVFDFQDVYYRIYWKDLEQDSGCLDRPLTPYCSVKSSQSSYTQLFPVFSKISWQLNVDGLSSLISYHVWERYEALLLGVKYQEALFELDVLNDKYNLGYESSYLKVKWGFDRMNPNQAKFWQMTLDASWPIL